MEPMEKVLEDSKIKVGDVVMVVTEGEGSHHHHGFKIGQLVTVIELLEDVLVLEGDYEHVCGDVSLIKQRLDYDEVIRTFIYLEGEEQ